MSMQNKLKTRGIVMLIGFFIVLAIIFTPIFPGKMNGFNYMDNLFNTISKGSSYFIPDSLKSSDQYAGKMIDVKIKMDNDQQAINTAKLFQVSGAEATVAGKELAVKGDMSLMIKNSLADADQMFHNNGSPVAGKYGYNEREALFNWWTAFKAIDKTLTAQENFKEAKAFNSIRSKALEPAYNYYGVAASNYKDNIGLIVAALLFYVVYTVWYGFGLMYLFEGLGLKIGH